MNTHTITNETIMPDGRPFFAWDNERIMINAELTALKSSLESARIFRAACGSTYEQWQDHGSIDWNFRIKGSDAISATDFKYNLEKYLKVI